MPATTVNVERIQALMGEAAEAAVASLPLESPLLAGFAGEGTLPDEFLPGPDAQGVVCGLRGGLSGRLVLLAGTAVVEAVLAGPLGASGLAAALEPALARALAVLEQAAGAPVTLDIPALVEPASVVAGAGAAWSFSGAPLFEGEEHRASLLLLLDDPSSEGQADGAGEPGNGAVEAPLAAVHSFPLVAEALNADVTSAHPLHLLRDVEMDITVELGRTRMSVRHVLSLMPGSVVELDRAAGSPVDLLVNGTLIGRGEVVVIDEEFGVRISEIVGRDESEG